MKEIYVDRNIKEGEIIRKKIFIFIALIISFLLVFPLIKTKASSVVSEDNPFNVVFHIFNTKIERTYTTAEAPEEFNNIASNPMSYADNQYLLVFTSWGYTWGIGSHNVCVYGDSNGLNGNVVHYYANFYYHDSFLHGISFLEYVYLLNPLIKDTPLTDKGFDMLIALGFDDDYYESLLITPEMLFSSSFFRSLFNLLMLYDSGDFSRDFYLANETEIKQAFIDFFSFIDESYFTDFFNQIPEEYFFYNLTSFLNISTSKGTFSNGESSVSIEGVQGNRLDLNILSKPTAQGYNCIETYNDLYFFYFDEVDFDYEITDDKFEIITYKITYNTNGGSIGIIVANSYTVDSEDMELPQTYIENYNFVGWFDNPDFTGTPITTIKQGSTGDIELYASFEIKTYKISLIVNLSDLLFEDIVVDSGTQLKDVILPTPAKKNYKFNGWFSDDLFQENINLDNEVKSDLTLYGNLEFVEEEIVNPDEPVISGDSDIPDLDIEVIYPEEELQRILNLASIVLIISFVSILLKKIKRRR